MEDLTVPKKRTESPKAVEENQEHIEAEETEDNYEARDPNPLTRESQENQQDVEDLKTEDSGIEDDERINLEEQKQPQRSSHPEESKENAVRQSEEAKETHSEEEDPEVEQDDEKVDEEEHDKENRQQEEGIEQKDLQEEQQKFEAKSEELHNQRLEFWSKKKIGFVNLKSWYEERATILCLHKKILETIYKKVIEKMRQSARESQKMVQYFLTISEMEKTYADHLNKSVGYLSDIKKDYQDFGKGYLDMCGHLERYERDLISHRQMSAKAIKQTIDETLGGVFKTQIQKIDTFTSKINKLIKRITAEEKTCEKVFAIFSSMLAEAEICMNHHRHYDKDFWLAENHCLVAAKVHLDGEREFCREIMDIWTEAEATEEIKIKNMKELYSEYFKKTSIVSDASRQLKLLMNDANHEDISSKIYCFKNMFSHEDLKAMSSLMELLGEKIDFVTATTDQVKLYLKTMKLKEPPQTTFIQKEGVLKRDPGFMKSWKDVICIITTEGFLHGFMQRADKDPVFTLNLRKITINPKKETKFEISEGKKGFMRGSKKIYLKARSLIEMEEWIKAMNKFD